MKTPSEPLRLTKEQIKKLLPHREPFLFVDEVLELIPGKSIVGKKVVRKEEPFFKGHFPGMPVFPGVLMVETMAQISALIVLTVPGMENLFGFFTGIEKFRFRTVVKPGDTLIVKSHVISYRHGFARSEGKVYVNDKVVAEGIVDAIFTDKKKAMEA
jgi:3-hydroxyacyl-[acyl-carrier-protein] dehydratase